MQQDSAKLGRHLSEYMREHRLTQADIAEKTEVDQATVSRFLKKPPHRVTVASQRLCSYAETVLSEVSVKGNQTTAQKALEVCWNKSEAHAQAASKILSALAELCQHDSEEEVASG
jgi:predicted XRE-type DNA-binding protein